MELNYIDIIFLKNTTKPPKRDWCGIFDVISPPGHTTHVNPFSCGVISTVHLINQSAAWENWGVPSMMWPDALIEFVKGTTINKHLQRNSKVVSFLVRLVIL